MKTFTASDGTRVYVSEPGDTGPRLVKVRLHGCDDITTAEIPLTDSELAVLKRVATAVNEQSAFSCQPEMRIDGEGECANCGDLLDRTDPDSTLCWLHEDD